MFARDLFRFCPACGNGNFQKNHPHSLHCSDCGLEYYQNPAACAGALIFNPAGEVLLAVRAHEPCKGMLDTPGGFINPGETVEEALSRELREETGVELSGFGYAVSYPNEYFYKRLTVHTLDFFFTIHLNQVPAFKPADDVAELIWFRPQDIDLEQVAFKSVRMALADLQAGKIRV